MSHNPKPTKEEKLAFLTMSLDDKIKRTKTLIMDWYAQFGGKVYVSFSGGKDSTVLLHIVRQLYPDVVGVFDDTGLEYPEIYFNKNNYWSFGIRLSQNKFCGGQYTEYEFRVDFWKYSIGVVF